MKDGNWIAMDKNLAKHFPDRKYSEIEAAFSLTLDYDNNKNVTVSGYAKLWQWSRSKVRSFLDTMGIDIIYPEDTAKNQKQKGQIKRQIKDRSRTEKKQIRMVDTKCLEIIKNRKKTDQGQIKDRSKDTTNKPINNPKPNPLINKDDFIKKMPDSVYKKGHSEEQVLNTIDNLIDYCLAKGKTYKDYYAALRNFLKKVIPKSKNESEKLSLDKFKEAIQYKKDNQKPGQPFKFKNPDLNKIIDKHPMINEYSFDSIKFDLAFKEYQKL